MRTALASLCLATLAAPCVAQDRPAAEAFLIAGDLAGGDKALSDRLKTNPDDDQARFGLGTIRFVRALERTVQSFYKHGLSPDIAGGVIPFARMPIPLNPKPEPITYDDLRAIFSRLVDDLRGCESTLAEIKGDSVKMPIRFGLVRLDFDGDGKATDEETLWRLYARMNANVRNQGVSPEDAQKFDLAFDRGDVAWLRGYCHLLSALAEFYLALDGQTLFDHSAHLFFADPKLPYPFLKHEPAGARSINASWIGDVVAFVHMMRFPVKEPAKMLAAHGHLKAMIALSRESWKFYLAEEDDDREWIPNPKQSTVVPGGRVTDEMVRGWGEFLDEADKLLDGELLVPFWRDAGGKGINLKKVFAEPREVDPVLWLQGTAAVPYLEEGRVTDKAVWERLMRVFRGEFFGFAIWFN